MAVPIEQFGIIEVRKPRVGENKPAAVEADVVIDTKRAGPLLLKLQNPFLSESGGEDMPRRQITDAP